MRFSTSVRGRGPVAAALLDCAVARPLALLSSPNPGSKEHAPPFIRCETGVEGRPVGPDERAEGFELRHSISCWIVRRTRFRPIELRAGSPSLVTLRFSRVSLRLGSIRIAGSIAAASSCRARRSRVTDVPSSPHLSTGPGRDRSVGLPVWLRAEPALRNGACPFIARGRPPFPSSPEHLHLVGRDSRYRRWP